MENYKRITDDEVFKAIEEINNEDEKALANALKSLLFITLDTRQFLRKMYKNTNVKQRVYKRPTKNSKDIIIGEEK